MKMVTSSERITPDMSDPFCWLRSDGNRTNMVVVGVMSPKKDHTGMRRFQPQQGSLLKL